jgi:hypothetical protein
MKIEIELTPVTARRIGRVVATLAIFGGGALVYASQTHFSSGQALTAAALNNNFDELYGAMSKPTVVKNGKSISLGGTYCGKSATPVDGAAVGGHTGAKAKCEASCASPTAHMCDAAEIVRSQQLGIALPSDKAWVNSFASSNTAVDCIAWTNGQANGVGMVWNVSPPILIVDACNLPYPIACCD